MLHLPRLMLAAPGSGSGKTMITCGMLQAFRKRGLNPASFKCGPDYIDPMFHTRVIGTPSRNLDTFFTDPKTTRYLFARTAQNAGISVLEGVMGLYDGLGGISVKASSYDLAAVTETPIILIVNARGMSLSVIPLIQGYLDYEKKVDLLSTSADPEQTPMRSPEPHNAQSLSSASKKDKRCTLNEKKVLRDSETQSMDKPRRTPGIIRGVILNQTTKMTYLLLKEEIEKQTGVRVYGYVPRLDDAAVESRHLGLVTPDEIADLKSRLSRLAGELEQCLDLDGILALAQNAANYEDEDLKIPDSIGKYVREQSQEASFSASLQSANIPQKMRDASRRRLNGHSLDVQCPSDKLYSLRIAVARDEAFCFYYQDNLDLLEMLGTKLVFFSPLWDEKLPEEASGLILGGGYPELYAQQLSENPSMKESISSAIKNGLPYLAECGGFMYLHEEMEDMKGRSWPMCGCISGRAFHTKKLGRFGYISLGVREKEVSLASCAATPVSTRSNTLKSTQEVLRQSGEAVCTQEGFLKPGETIRAHEFHYFDSTDPGNAYTARKPVGKRTWDCVHSSEHSAAGYPHLYYWSNPAFAARFVSSARRYCAAHQKGTLTI
ncbi:MAG: hydrogenobyrinic/cobyrinic acid a,c-diamide synthase [Lachnospiraceae bacterium]|nr:hydrogenobyrinic/cobyrinic acid a,c-diamide synthase [Lachnospiraceae bacterium]